ncbi:MAG: UvrB/UvrC motif-containing protein [Tissierellia bacterium]|nr:UvrB/UvrC motif-containing protein [Tissierellia bacterium]
MLCEHCHENNAHITYTMIENGQLKKMHLCEGCFTALWGQDFSFPLPGPGELNELLAQFLSLLPKEVEPVTKICHHCGRSFKEFQESFMLGCPHCYESFEGELSGLIERVQNASEHVGVRPARQEPELELEEQILLPEPELKEETPEEAPEEGLEAYRSLLKEAIAEERYEDAAIYRDKIRELEGDNG